ncbi:MAG: hypothetical protein HUJ27_14800 [Rhodobacteraceae bacterium]|nr:hypothetical protein [Paracoccaceae bacterium]
MSLPGLRPTIQQVQAELHNNWANDQEMLAGGRGGIAVPHLQNMFQL